MDETRIFIEGYRKVLGRVEPESQDTFGACGVDLLLGHYVALKGDYNRIITKEITIPEQVWRLEKQSSLGATLLKVTDTRIIADVEIALHKRNLENQ